MQHGPLQKRTLVLTAWGFFFRRLLTKRADPSHLLHQRLGQIGLGGLAGGQAAQLGYAGDDAGMFGEG